MDYYYAQVEQVAARFAEMKDALFETKTPLRLFLRLELLFEASRLEAIAAALRQIELTDSGDGNEQAEDSVLDETLAMLSETK